MDHGVQSSVVMFLLCIAVLECSVSQYGNQKRLIFCIWKYLTGVRILFYISTTFSTLDLRLFGKLNTDTHGIFTTVNI